MSNVLAVDGNSLGIQSFHGQQRQQYGGPVSATGEPIAGCSTVIRTVGKLIRDYQIAEVAIVFDNGGECFRHQAYAAYKGGRPEKDPRQVADLANLRRAFELMGIAVTAPDGVEADDVIGTIATQAIQSGKTVYICSGDWDLTQLVGPQCTFLCKRNATVVEIQEPEVIQKYNVRPSQVPDFKGLHGDKSDNIPGIYKIGPKTAARLLAQWESIEEIYQNIADVTGNDYTLLTQAGAKEAAYLSKRLATLKTDVSLPSQDFRVTSINLAQVEPLLRQFDLISEIALYRRFQPLSA